MIRALTALVAGTALAAATITAAAAERADLAIEELTAAPLCVGDRNWVEVVVANLGDAVADPGIGIVLTAQLPGHAPQRLTRSSRAIAPGERTRLRFDQIEITEPAEVLLRVEADPEHRIDDRSRGNNTAATLERAREPCDAGRGSTSGRSRPQGEHACNLSS